MVKQRIIKTALSLILSGAIISGAVSYFNLGNIQADNDQDFASGKLVVITDDSESIPGEGTILASGNGTALVSYPSSADALMAYEIMDSEGIRVSPETVFAAASDMLEDNAKVPEETEDALNVLAFESNVPIPADEAAGNMIALIDTGANGDDIYERISLVGDEGYDINGHGTAMARAIRQQDKDARIISIKALNDEGLGSISSVYAAIQIAIERKVKVINLSIIARSVEENSVIRSAINDALMANIIVVGAAGNEGKDVADYIPANIPGVIVAGAADSRGKRLESSNFGDTVDWNVTAESTSYASAILAGFINKNCSSDAGLIVTIVDELGKGLIWSKDYDPEQDDLEVFADDWIDIDTDYVNTEVMELNEYEEITSVRYSPEEDLIELTCTEYSIPQDGSFVPAAWTYAVITNKNYIAGGSDWMQVNVYTLYNDIEKYFQNVVHGVSASGRVVGFSVNYTPGTFEMSQETAVYGGTAAKATDLVYQATFADGTQSAICPANGTGAIHATKSSPIRTIVAYFTNKRLPYLYKQQRTMFINGLDINRPAVNSGLVTDESGVWYEECGINAGKNDVTGSKTKDFNRIALALRLRCFSVYYQKSSDVNDLHYVGSECVGNTFDFASAEASAEVVSNYDRLEGWSYEVVNSSVRPDGRPVFPAEDTPVDMENSRNDYIVVIRQVEEYDIRYQHRTLNRKTGAWSTGNLTTTNANKYRKSSSFTLTNPTPESGYEFLGWVEGEASRVTATSGNKTYVFSGASRSGVAYMTALFAQIEYRISYDLNDSAGSTRAANDRRNPAVYVVSDNVTIYPPTRDGYSFQGWKQDGGAILNKNLIISGSKKQNTSLVAMWSPVGYRISFDDEYVTSGTMEPLEMVYDRQVNLPVIGYERTGYDLVGVSLVKGETKNVIPLSGAVNNLSKNEGENVILYPVWKQKRGSASLKVYEPDSGLPIVGMGFELVTGAGTLVREGLVSDEEGMVYVDDLCWNDPSDPVNSFDNGGENAGTEYVFVAKDIPEGFADMRDAAFVLNGENTGSRIDSKRAILLKTIDLDIESYCENPPGHYVPAFMYRITGRTTMGVEKAYTLMSKMEWKDHSSIGRLKLPVGSYRIIAMPLRGYELREVIPGDNMAVEGQQGVVSMEDGGSAGIRFNWDLSGAYSRQGAKLKINSFKTGGTE